MISPSANMPAELVPAFRQLAETYDFEDRSTLWAELLAGLVYDRDRGKLSEEGHELLSTMLKELPPRRHSAGE